MQDFPHKSGIYKIKNIANNKCYIGQSQDIAKRLGYHLHALKSGEHYNNHLQNAWDKYGADSFDISVICVCHTSELDDMEIRYIKEYDSFINGYNETAGGSGKRGYTFSQESRKKMKDSHADVRYEKNPRAKSIVLLNTGECFSCILEAGEKYNVAKADISKNALGKSHYAGVKNGERLVWRYLDDYSAMSNEEIKHLIMDAISYERGRTNRTKKVVCVNNGFIFNSISDANTYASVKSGVGDVCRGICNTAGVDPKTNERLRWMFYDDYFNSPTTNIGLNSDMVIVAS